MAKMALAKSITGSVNQELSDRAIRHAVYLEQLKTHEVTQIMSTMNRKVIPDLLKTVESRLSRIKSRGYDTGPWTTQRLKELTSASTEVIHTGFKQLRKELRDNLKDIAVSEAQFQKALLSKTIPFEIDLVTPDIATLRSIVTSQPMQGRFLNEWFSGLAKNTAAKISGQINIGLAQGESVEKIVRRLAGTRAAGYMDALLGETRRNIRSVVRTSVSHVTNHARMATYDANSEVIKGWQFIATLDARTTELCMGYDGKTYQLGETGPMPPLHHQCRSTTVPIVKSWKELGIKDAKDVPMKTRASMNGQVSARQTYGQWLKKQPKAIQNEALGPTRAGLFRKGIIKVDRFTDSSGQKLTLTELAEKEGIGPEFLKYKSGPETAYLKTAKMVDYDDAQKLWVRRINNDDRAQDVMMNWAGDDHAKLRHLDGYLQKGLRPTKYDRESYTLFKSLLKEAPKTQGSFFRGLRLTDGDLARLKVGKSLTLKATSSFTTKRTVAQGFAQGAPEVTQVGKNLVVFRAKAARAIDIHKIIGDKYGVEGERLLLKGTKLKITRIHRQGRYTIIDMKDVQSPIKRFKPVRVPERIKVPTFKQREIAIAAKKQKLVKASWDTPLKEFRLQGDDTKFLESVRIEAAKELKRVGNKFYGSKLPLMEDPILVIRQGETIGKVKGQSLLGKHVFGGKTSSRIELSTAEFGIPEKITLGRWKAAEGFKANLRHEYAHDIYLRNFEKPQKEVWNVFFRKTSKNKISIYAGENEKEFFAECFTVFTSPKYKPSMLPKPIHTWMTQRIKKMYMGDL